MFDFEIYTDSSGVFFKGHILIFFHLLVCGVRYLGEQYEKLADIQVMIVNIR